MQLQHLTVTSLIAFPKHHSERRRRGLLPCWCNFKGLHHLSDAVLVWYLVFWRSYFMNECNFRTSVIHMPLASTVGLLPAQKHKLQVIHVPATVVTKTMTLYRNNLHSLLRRSLYLQGFLVLPQGTPSLPSSLPAISKEWRLLNCNSEVVHGTWKGHISEELT